MSLLQAVRTGATLPSPPDSSNDWAYPPAYSAREAGREPRQEALVEQNKRPGLLPLGAHQKLQDTLALLQQLARSGTADTASLHLIEANLILLKQDVLSETPEADEIKETEATRAFLKDLAKSRSPNSLSLHAIQSALTLLRQRAYADRSESSVLDEIQATLTLLKQTGLSDAPPAPKPNDSEATARDRKGTVAKSTMSNGAAAGTAASGGPDADALAVEIHRHQETKQSLANTVATVRELNARLDKVNGYIEDFRADRDDFKKQVVELEETIRHRESEIQRQETQIRALEAEAVSHAARLETLQWELKTERAEREVLLTDAAQREAALREAKRQMDDLEKRAQEDATSFTEKDQQAEMLRAQLREAREGIAQRDKKLRSAAAEKKRHLQETVGVVGESVLNLNSELERLMAALESMEVAASEKRRRKQKP